MLLCGIPTLAVAFFLRSLPLLVHLFNVAIFTRLFLKNGFQNFAHRHFGNLLFHATIPRHKRPRPLNSVKSSSATTSCATPRLIFLCKCSTPSERFSKYDGALHNDCDVIATAHHEGEEAAVKLPTILLGLIITAKAHPAPVAGAQGFYNKGIARHA